MKNVKIKVPAKINLTLDITGTDGGYHQLRSLVCTVNLFDEITVKANKTGKVRIFDDDKCGCMEENNNAFKVASDYIKETACPAVDIKIKKRIPLGGGMGGSSADSAGTLIAMEKLFKGGADLSVLAEKSGSDTPYMLKGGYAVMQGRGEKIEYLALKEKFYLLIAVGDSSVTAKESYAEYDKNGKTYPPCTDTVLNFLNKGDADGALFTLKNDLAEGSYKICPDIKRNIGLMKKAGAITAVMTGSGSAVIGYFTDKKERDIAYKKLKFKLKRRLIPAETITETV